MTLKLNRQMMKGIILGSFFLTLPYSYELSHAATTGSAKAPLNFRASPNGKEIKGIGGVSEGEKFTILKTTNSWVKIKRSNGRVGWIYKKYVRINSEKPADRTSTASATRDAEPIAQGSLTGVRHHLNIRKSPTSNSRDIGNLRPDDKFDILGEAKNGWYKVRSIDGTIGYASDHYIRKIALQPENIPVPTPRPDRNEVPPQAVGEGRFAGVSSDDLASSAERAEETAEEETEITNPLENNPFISAYAPEEQATAALEQLAQLGHGGSLEVASANDDNSEVEAQCDDCLLQTASMNGPNREVFDLGSKVFDFHAREFAGQSAREKCYGNVILKAAKDNVRRNFNRSYSAGLCAYGVRTSLQKAGVNRVGALGDALMYYKQSARHEGTLAQLGFANEIAKYKTAENAPPGSVLVFGGPYSTRVLNNPGRYLRGGRVIKRHGGSAGDYVGHVTIKGDDGKYYTDGRTADPAIANRHLVGIFVLKECKSCTASVKRQCGG